MLKLAVFLAVVAFAFGDVSVHNVSDYENSLKIVGGQVTNIALHPWQVSVQFRNQHFCGGFLISANWVVTAAHCLTQGYSTNLNIRAGSAIHNFGGQTAAVSRYIIHPSYSDPTLNNDIALLYLSTSINTANARAASLPAVGQVVSEGATLTVTGWGATSESGSGSLQLLQVLVPVINQATCRSRYISNREVTSSMFCAGFLGVGGKDACQGDSGGPATINGQVVGVVSWGAGCARPNFPGVYAKVSALRSWIQQNTGI